MQSISILGSAEEMVTDVCANRMDISFEPFTKKCRSAMRKMKTQYEHKVEREVTILPSCALHMTIFN
ncbi:hypothetical protein HanXRQr2_Chr13g0605651 [Helianthus annuus]|uniref:Uncharacterized protein n=1 Tax=Helianthus annuus TaxID=4232 RepID=A0A9K3EKD2_HELAN|nr:hypothetical protein HanXRQr2_Chr13g0605651 [Helianthus annuus]KAJ0850690.1 hypothetical protein HanPSC8_Chr13g0583761 [Helianthus annuus]